MTELQKTSVTKGLSATVTRERLEIWKRTYLKGFSDEEFVHAANICARTGLSLEAKQISFIRFKDKDGRHSVTPIVTIDGFRSIADRTGKYGGQEGPFFYDKENKEWLDVWPHDDHFPHAAKVGVYKLGIQKAFWGIAHWKSFMQGYNGKPNHTWQKMGEHMLGKCAEAMALRKAFPQDLGNLYSSDESTAEREADSYVAPASDTKKVETRQQKMFKAFKVNFDLEPELICDHLNCSVDDSLTTDQISECEKIYGDLRDGKISAKDFSEKIYSKTEVID